MPVQAPQWTDFLSCPICCQTFDENIRKPISLGCGHTVCKMCLNKLHRKACPFDQTTINTDIDMLPVNSALLQLVGAQIPEPQSVTLCTGAENTKHYEEAKKCVEELALYLKPLSSTRGVVLSSAAQSVLSRPMQRKLVTLVHCQLVEEEGRIRAMRAARSLGERTVTELILQHQNPQQLSSNLWAAVRARGCQFLGPAMQEEALKLVLLALEDGSALSRKVLVLFVVQRLEPRFPQASKTSIGHVVQLLYRASCFKVTKRDEDSSLMQLKEEFRTYEALRREHDSQIVQIAMEAGLRIAPDQWSSLLYGDLSHKSHMQSIIDKLQTPASFAQSVQELTIALQRTGDPANLNRLRPHLELLANIDPSPDAPSPTWEQLECGLVAVKTVVHGLVDFIQNHSKKGTDQQQSAQSSKYKTSMCRDLRQRGGCPRGASCTFAHSQDELEKFRMRNKRLAAGRPLSQSLTQLSKVGGVMPVTSSTLSDEGSLETGTKPVSIQNGMVAASSSIAQLISRGTDCTYDIAMKSGKMSDMSMSAPGSVSGSPPDSRMDMPQKSSLGALPLNTLSAPPRISAELPPMPVSKPIQMVPRGSQMYPPTQQPDVYYQDPRSSAASYEAAPYAPNLYYPHHSSGSVTPYLPQYRRASNVAEPPMPPSTLQYQDHYPTYISERMGSSQYSSPQQYPLAQPVSGMYPAHYGSRRVYHPPQSYTREDMRNSPIPVDMPSAVTNYITEPRERYAPENYYTVSPHPNQIRPPYRDPHGRVPQHQPQPQPSLDYLHRRRKELMAQLEERKTISPPPFPPTAALPSSFVDVSPEYSDEDLKAVKKYKDHEYTAQYSPWSCDTIGSYIGSQNAQSKDVMPSSGMEMNNVDSKGLREQLMNLDIQRRAAESKEEDPIIPFGELPTVSKFGAISRTSKTSYQTTGPVQAVASQGIATKPISVSDYNPYGNHSSWTNSPVSYSSHQTMPTQGHFIDRERLSMQEIAAPGKHPVPQMPPTDREQLRLELQQVNQQISQQNQLRGIEPANSPVLLQREVANQAPQQHTSWPSLMSSEQLSLELHQVEREIGKRKYELETESRPSLDIQYKLASNNQTENGQSEQQHKAPEDLQPSLSEGSKVGASSFITESSISALTNKAASLNLAPDTEGAGDRCDSQQNGL
ncbi:roquin-1-like isoform X1 [Carcharodon carcharias]|uniref:roquin-1-like isoform X1 n=1 Tax=Carcharodon carcharias TaxID=13397 RepID=UPI001B7E4ABA|nr:roquin-1-like isoform X1 [Carcharodon carcharias]XP_041063858.1 roquin-1-like isoform X1 [Carcharodon carcharias]XP_041063859.1 roquin-1-like isoform X1 [Carcharodon carcharias]XP_041063860.1 roquin-1-like isoform X1 [Carcharodon carcharias]XP_041063861.1 roquin-1-like isoform X1 [Carcharodon carcharias]XP_041063862.1 roquin-1-like isoform X1 [Carcharodon carcharias]